MYPLKRVMVGLDLTDLDDQLISYLDFLNKIYDFNDIYFVHVAKSLKLPERVREKYPDVLAPVDESIERDIQKKVDKLVTPKKGTNVKVEVREGDPEHKILNWTGIKEIDLLIMGRKLDLKGEGHLPNRMSRLIHCSVLIIPEGAKHKIDKVLVPLDFSTTCQLALDEAKTLAKKTECKILVQNSYEVPNGYHTTGKTYEEFTSIMEKNAMDDMMEFLKKSNTKESDVEIILTFDEEDDPAERAYEVAQSHTVDMLIIASRGRTGIASLILGSFAEKMIQYDSNLPLFVAKDKKENLNFFQALLKI